MDKELRIILLEDNPADAELEQRELRKAGLRFTAEVVHERSGFVQALEAGSPDLILADYSLPGFDAVSALELAKARHPHVPFIIVSGAVGEETATDVIRAGATDYVLKQRLKRLGPVVERALREAQQLYENARIEQQLAHEREALRESEQTLRLLIDGVNDCAIYMISPEGRVKTWNAGAQRIMGWTVEEIIGRHISTFFPPADDVRGGPARQLAIATRDGFFDEESFQIRKDGSVVWARVTLTATYTDDGSLRGFSTVLRDIAQAVRADVELSAAKLVAERARSEAESANRAKDHFLAVLSHELRTPLTPALAIVGMLQQDPRFDADTRENLDVIRRNVEIEARLIDDLLDVTRIAHGKVELNRQTVDLGVIIRAAAEVCRADVQTRCLEFGVDVAAGDYLIHADAARMQQVFWNLIKNAVKFTPHGGCIGVKVAMDGRQPEHGTNGAAGESFAIVDVCDSGEGIEPEVLPQIFQPFEQGGKRITRQFGGLGLGLAISKAIVELHGGTIIAHSDGRGKGSRFRVRLPLVSEAAELRSPAAGGRDRSGRETPGGDTRSLRILLVEDHGDTARIMARLLTGKGHRVCTAGDVTTAIDQAESSEFDLLISDLGLPDGTGLELLQTLRSKGWDVPAIALSGYGQDEDVRRTREAGFSQHLTKPVDFPRLEAAVGNVLVGAPKKPAGNLSRR